MTTLLILRHGPAESPAPGQADETRALVPEGRRRVQAAMTRLVGLGYRPDRIFHSPYRRTTETAAILQEAAGGCPCEVQEELVPRGSPERIAAWLEQLAREAPSGTLACVSHEPLVSLLLHDLARVQDELGTAGCAVLQSGTRGWRLERILRPVDGLA